MIKYRYTLLMMLMVVVQLRAVSVFSQPVKNGQKNAVDFSLSDSAGNEIRLSDYRGKIIVLNFWATWCGPCMREMPDLEKIHQNYRDKNVQVLGIAVISKLQDIPKQIEQTGISYPVLIGNKEIIADYGYFSTIPNTFIIDPDGAIIKEFSGSQSYSDFQKELDARIAGYKKAL